MAAAADRVVAARPRVAKAVMTNRVVRPGGRPEDNEDLTGR